MKESKRDYLIRRRKELDFEIGEKHDRLFEQARREYYAECEEAWKNYNVDKRKD